MEKVSSNKRFEQAKNINNTIFSIGNSAIVSKIFDSFLGDIFKKEASEAYQSFSVI